MKKISRFSLDLVTTHEGFSALMGEWSELVKHCPNIPIFLHSEWVRCWLSSFKAKPWILTLRTNDGKLFGVAPFMIETKKTIKKIRFIGTGMTQPDHLDVICREADYLEVVSNIAKGLNQYSERWDVLHLEGINQESALIGCLDTLIGKGFRRKETVCPYIDLSGVKDWETFQKERLSSHMRSKGLRYLQNVLERENPNMVRYERVESLDDLSIALESLICQHKIRWAEKEIFTPFQDEQFLNFHRNFAIEALKNGWLGLYRLRVREQTIATVYGFHYQNRFYDYQHALDGTWSRFSPGRQLISYIIKDCIKNAHSEYDFLCGTEKYKYSWTQSERKDQQVIWTNGFRGQLVKNCLQLRDYLKLKFKERNQILIN